MKQLLHRDDIDVHRQDINGRTPLSIAPEYGHAEIVRILVDETHYAKRINSSEIGPNFSKATQDLSGNGPDLAPQSGSTEIDSRDNDSLNPLYYASDNGKTETVKLLLEKGGVDINPQDTYGRSPLVRATQQEHNEVVRLLLEQADVDINIKDCLKWTALFYAAGRRIRNPLQICYLRKMASKWVLPSPVANV